MSIPCVVARPLAQARRMLEEAGVTVAAVKETAPPRGAPSGPLRVLRQRETDAGLELTAGRSTPLVGENGLDD